MPLLCKICTSLILFPVHGRISAKLYSSAWNYSVTYYNPEHGGHEMLEFLLPSYFRELLFSFFFSTPHHGYCFQITLVPPMPWPDVSSSSLMKCLRKVGLEQRKGNSRRGEEASVCAQRKALQTIINGGSMRHIPSRYFRSKKSNTA